MVLTKATHQSAKCLTFDCSREISPELFLDRLLLLKVYKILAEKVQRCRESREYAKFKEQPISCFKYYKNLVHFDLSTKKYQNFFAKWFVLWKGYNV